MSAPRSLFFDLDGTLTDPYVGIRRSIEYALESLGLSAGIDDFRWCVGPPLHDSFVGLVGSASADRALALYRERYMDTGWRENVPYDGVVEMLETLSKKGHRLMLATSKPAPATQRVIEHFDLARWFSGVYASALDGTHADKPSLLRHALWTERSLHQPIMIGDRRYDIDGAKANGLESIGVSYGFGDEAELRTAGATHIADSPAHIVEIVTRL